MMTLPIFLAVLTATSASPDSDALLKASRAERERRARIERGAPVIDDEKLKQEVEGVPLSIIESGPPAPEGLPAPSVGPPEPGPQVAGEAPPVKDEAYFRARMSDAQRRIADLTSDREWTKRKITMLRSDLIVPGDPLREFNRRVELESEMKEQARLEQELADALQEPDRIRTEGRRVNAPAAWFR